MMIVLTLFGVGCKHGLFTVNGGTAITGCSKVHMSGAVVLSCTVDNVATNVTNTLLTKGINSYCLTVNSACRFRSVTTITVKKASVLNNGNGCLKAITNSLAVAVLLNVLITLGLPFNMRAVTCKLVILVSIVMSIMDSGGGWGWAFVLRLRRRLR